MSHMRQVLLQVLYDDWHVRPSYLPALKYLIETEATLATPYELSEGYFIRRGIVYQIGKEEAFWLEPVDGRAEQLLIPNPALRENLLDLLACHPLYAMWFGHEP